MPNRNAGQITPLVPEHFAFIKLPVVIRIFEYQNSIGRIILLPLGVRIVFYDPKAPTIIKIESDGTTQIGLSGKEGHMKTVRDCNSLERLFWREGDVSRILAVGNSLGQVISGGFLDSYRCRADRGQQQGEENRTQGGEW